MLGWLGVVVFMCVCVLYTNLPTFIVVALDFSRIFFSRSLFWWWIWLSYCSSCRCWTFSLPIKSHSSFNFHLYVCTLLVWLCPCLCLCVFVNFTYGFFPFAASLSLRVSFLCNKELQKYIYFDIKVKRWPGPNLHSFIISCVAILCVCHLMNRRSFFHHWLFQAF